MNVMKAFSNVQLAQFVGTLKAVIAAIVQDQIQMTAKVLLLLLCHIASMLSFNIFMTGGCTKGDRAYPNHGVRYKSGGCEECKCEVSISVCEHLFHVS